MIPLARARLCLDEDLVYDGAAGLHCPHCGRSTTWLLRVWLNRADRKERGDA